MNCNAFFPIYVQDTCKRFMEAESAARGYKMTWTRDESGVIPQQTDFKACGLFICARAFQEVRAKVTMNVTKPTHVN